MISRYFAISVACFIAAAGVTTAEAQQSQKPPTVQVSSQAVDAKAELMRMAEYLSKAQSFSLTMDASYDVVQKSGEKIEFGEIRHVTLNRPNDLRVDLSNRDGLQQRVLFDGKSLTLFTPSQNIFATLDRPGSVDEAIRYLVDDLQTRIPLSAMLLTSLPQELDKHVIALAAVNDETIDGKPTEHLAARTQDDVDFQVWIASGDQPVPLRIVLTYNHAPGQPQFRAALSDWNFHPQIDPTAFAFVRPPGAEAVAFMVPTHGAPQPIKGRKK